MRLLATTNLFPPHTMVSTHTLPNSEWWVRVLKGKWKEKRMGTGAKVSCTVGPAEPGAPLASYA